MDGPIRSHPPGPRVSVLALPGWLLLAALVLSTWLGLALPAAAALAAGLPLAAGAAAALSRLGLVGIERAPRRAAALPVAAALLAATVVFLFLQTNHLHDCQCHQGYTLAIHRGGLPVAALHDATQPSAYHFGFDVVAAALHGAFLPPTVEMSLDLASGLALLALGLAAAALLGRWPVPATVRALGVLLLVFGTGPLFVATFGDPIAPHDDWLHRWHAASFLSVAGLAGRRPAVLGALVLVLFLDLVRGGALDRERLAGRGAWGSAVLLGLLVAAAGLVAEELVPLAAVGLAAALLAARGAGARRLLPRLAAVLAVVLPLAVLSGGLFRALLAGTEGAPALSLAAPGLPSFRSGRLPAGSAAWWLTLALELGPLPLLLPALLARRSATPRPYAAAVLALVATGFVLAHGLSFGGYDTDLHRFALPLGHLGFLHAPVLLWTLPRRRALAIALVTAGAALGLVTGVGYLFRAVSPVDLLTNALAPPPVTQDVALFAALLPLGLALLLLAPGRRPPWPAALAAAGLGLLALGGADRLDAGRVVPPWPAAQCTGEHQARGAVAAAADRVAALLATGHPGPVLARPPLADALMARGLPVLAAARPPEHGRADPAATHALVAAFDGADWARLRPGLLALPPEDAAAVTQRLVAAGVPVAPLPSPPGADLALAALGPPPSTPRPVPPVLVYRTPRPETAGAGRPSACPSAQGRAIAAAQQPAILALFRPHEPDGQPRDGVAVTDLAIAADGFTATLQPAGGEPFDVHFSGCPSAAPFATTPSFYVTADPPAPDAGAAALHLVAVVAGNDDGQFWDRPELARLFGAAATTALDAPLPPPSPLPNTLAYALLALLLLVPLAAKRKSTK